ncbi:MAG: winged helix-turn-helix transcriptional regulator, partial [Gemmatimonadota bacterium]|nr:winged helix-turn-helix transcriptional regulator [Gemmatimonadota bacterium]
HRLVAAHAQNAIFRGALLISSEVKCAHFHGIEVAKPIPSHQVYKGTVFELVDQAVDFVMSKIALAVGTRAETVQAPVAYEIPKEVVTEAIVNAVAHRDYTDNSSVQVMLFADRLEVMNSGRLPPPLTVEKLRVAHQSLPANPLIAESMYLLRYIEKMGTGTVDMIRRCAEAGLPEPEFEAGAGFTTRIWRAGGNGKRRGSGRATTQETQGGRRETTQEDRDTTQQLATTTQETGEATQEVVGKADSMPTRDRILALLRSDPTLTRAALASRIGITPGGVKYHLDRLRKAGRIRHVGPTKKGRWEILESESTLP